MRGVKAAFFRALIAIIAGGLMVQYREQMVNWTIICIGLLFFLSGIISIGVFITGRNRYFNSLSEDKTGNTPEGLSVTIAKPAPPIVGLGSVILGLILCLMPTTFTNFLVYIFAGIIIVGAIGQYTSLAIAAKAIKKYKSELRQTITDKNEISEVPSCGWIFWIIPTLLLLFGVYAILDPIAIKSSPFLYIGIAMIIYGLSEVINAIKLHSVQKEIAIQNITLEETKAISESEEKAEDTEIQE